MSKNWRITVPALMLICLSAATMLCADDEVARKEQERIKKWEPAIAAYEEQDRKTPPAAGSVLFVGSSTIKLWDTAAAFGDLPTLNRGFGGSQLADTLFYLDRLVLKHRPRIVVLHAGGNDLAGGKSVEQVASDFRGIVQRIRKELPETRIVFIGIKPTLARKKLVEKERELNGQIRDDLKAQQAGVFIEVDRPFSDAQGEPRADLLRDDKLHLNDAGYKVLNELVRPHLAVK